MSWKGRFQAKRPQHALPFPVLPRVKTRVTKRHSAVSCAIQSTADMTDLCAIIAEFISNLWSAKSLRSTVQTLAGNAGRSFLFRLVSCPTWQQCMVHWKEKFRTRKIRKIQTKSKSFLQINLIQTIPVIFAEKSGQPKTNFYLTMPSCTSNQISWKSIRSMTLKLATFAKISLHWKTLCSVILQLNTKPSKNGFVTRLRLQNHWGPSCKNWHVTCAKESVSQRLVFFTTTAACTTNQN